MLCYRLWDGKRINNHLFVEREYRFHDYRNYTARFVDTFHYKIDSQDLYASSWHQLEDFRISWFFDWLQVNPKVQNSQETFTVDGSCCRSWKLIWAESTFPIKHISPLLIPFCEYHEPRFIINSPPLSQISSLHSWRIRARRIWTGRTGLQRGRWKWNAEI